MPTYFSSETGGGSVLAANQAVILVTNFGGTIRARTCFNATTTSPGGWVWSSPSAVAASVDAGAGPSVCGPAPDGKIFCFYITLAGSLAMKYSADLGKTWY